MANLNLSQLRENLLNNNEILIKSDEISPVIESIRDYNRSLDTPNCMLADVLDDDWKVLGARYLSIMLDLDVSITEINSSTVSISIT